MSVATAPKCCEACGERRVTFHHCVCDDLNLFHRDGPCARCGKCAGFQPNGTRLTVHEHIALAAISP